jgi:hypothetical protein
VADYTISCRRLVELTTDYFEDAMSARMRTTFEQHLVVCQPCIAHLEQVRVTREVLGSLARDARPPAAAVFEAIGEGGG